MIESTGQIIKTLRKKHKLTQDQLAEAIGSNRVTIASYEAGKYRPSSEAVLKIADVFNVSTDYILGNISQAEEVASDDAIKFALFGDVSNITDAQFEEVKRYARYIKERGSD